MPSRLAVTAATAPASPLPAPAGAPARAPAGPPAHPPGRPRRSRGPLRSIAVDGLPEEDILYREGDVTIMPSWLEIGGRESFAVRSIVRLSLSRHAPPRGVASAVFAVALLLVALCVAHLLGDTLPFLLAWTLLAASVALALVASHVAFVRPSEHVLEVRLNDGTSLRVTRSERDALLELHRALTRAMERQRGA